MENVKDDSKIIIKQNAKQLEPILAKITEEYLNKYGEKVYFSKYHSARYQLEPEVIHFYIQKIPLRLLSLGFVPGRIMEVEIQRYYTFITYYNKDIEEIAHPFISDYVNKNDIEHKIIREGYYD